MSRFKAGLALGLAVGYVFGTKAGRERYLQMQRNVRRASRLWQKASSSSLAQKAVHKAGATTLGKVPWMRDRLADRQSKNGFEEQPASSF
jgi:hypothetical protein